MNNVYQKRTKYRHVHESVDICTDDNERVHESVVLCTCEDKHVPETMLREELKSHLGYAKNRRARASMPAAENARNRFEQRFMNEP